MATSTLQKLLRTRSQSASRILSHFHKPPQPLLPQIPQFPEPIDQIPFLCNPNVDYSEQRPSIASNAYPAFSFEFFLNLISTPPLIRYDSYDENTMHDDSCTIRADSVKKKRKKKMNKHKLGKLRKRLRRKTKT